MTVGVTQDPEGEEMFEPDWETLFSEAKAAGASALSALLKQLPPGHPMFERVQAALVEAEAHEAEEKQKRDSYRARTSP